MKHATLILLAVIAMLSAPGIAGAAEPEHRGGGVQEAAGLGLGAVIGGLIAGPPGVILGAAGGLWYGNHEDEETARIASLQTRLTQEQTQTAYLENQLDTLRRQFGQELKKVKLQDRTDALSQLSEGVSLAVFFRTDSAEVDAEMQTRIHQLAGFLKSYPEIQLHLEAHADRRGSDGYNKELSARRAAAVKAALLQAGVDSGRVHTYAYGESAAGHQAGDIEGMLFDRRVNIVLNLDTRA